LVRAFAVVRLYIVHDETKLRLSTIPLFVVLLYSEHGGGEEAVFSERQSLTNIIDQYSVMRSDEKGQHFVKNV